MTDEETLPPLDLRVARVAEALEHPNADRLLVLRIDLGDESRQIVAGLAEHYTPVELRGRHIVVVANLEPAHLRGEVSEGMLLAAEDGEGRLGLLLAPGAEPGTSLSATGQAPPGASITIDDFRRHELLARPDRITLDGSTLEGAELVMDREVYGRLR